MMVVVMRSLEMDKRTAPDIPQYSPMYGEGLSE